MREVSPCAPRSRTHHRPDRRSATSCRYPITPRVDFDPDKLLREERERRLGPRPRSGPPRQGVYGDRASAGRRPRLSLRGRPVGALPALPALGGRAARRPARSPTTSRICRLLVHGARPQQPRRADRAYAARSWRPRPRTGGRQMTTLLVDNYDSYTYNVFHLLAAVTGEEPIVVHNDIVSWRILSRWDFDAIVLSPGPGRPDRWHDFGVCADILRSSRDPGPGGLSRPPGARAACLTATVASGADGDARTSQPGAPRRRSTSSTASRRTSRSSATTRWRSLARLGRRAA